VAGSELSEADRSYRVEIVRKAIHLCSLSVPIVYFGVSKALALWVITPVTACFIAVDISRYYNRPIQDWFYRTFGWLLRPRESDTQRKRLNGATYVSISAALCILILPKLIAITSFSILIIADMTAALIGKRFGRHRFLGKTLEGSLAFFVSAVIVVLLTPKFEYRVEEYLVGMVAAVVGVIVEAAPIDIDDNLSIPLCVGGTMWALYHFALPMIDIYRHG
jgi:dolichol kinase